MYSEGAHYWPVFESVIEALSHKKIEVTYYSSDKNDPGVGLQLPHYRSEYIGNVNTASYRLNRLHADMVVMTTPQLDVFQLRRSKHVKHYMHILHSPVDLLAYNRYAFDSFDSILCGGKHHIKSMRALEKIRNLSPKKLYQTGITYFDNIKPKKQTTKPNTRTRILIAPTWGENGLFTLYGSEFLSQFIDTEYIVTVRPHPQMRISQKKLYQDISNICEEYAHISLDDNYSAHDSLDTADILISDVSGIIFDCAFVYQKPIICIESNINQSGREAEDVSLPIWEVEALKQVSTYISKKEARQVPEILSKLLNQKDRFTKKTTQMIQLRKEFCYNFDSAGVQAAKDIESILITLS